MLKLVVADFDGTLLPYGEKRVSDKTKKLIKELLDGGVYFAVASGRTYSELSALMGELSDRIYFVCDDGALIVKGGGVIFKKPFSKDALSRFFDSYAFKGAVLYSLNKAYLVGDVSRPVTYEKTPKRVERPFEITEDVFKTVAETKTFTLCNSSDFRVHYSEGKVAEFVSPFANKGVALADLQLHLGVSKYDTAAMGDAANDIAMMKHASQTFSIGQRSKELASVCAVSAPAAEEVLQNMVSDLKKR